jgi:hypothetical protein
MMNNGGGLAKAAQQQQPMPEPRAQESLGEEENLDVELAEKLGMKLMKTPEAMKTLQGAVSGQGDPVAKLGVFFSQLIDKIQTKLDDSPTPLSPRIWLSQGGVLDLWMEDLSEEGMVPAELAEPVKEEVLNVLKLQEQSVGPGGGPSQEQMMQEEQPMGMMGGPMP